MKRKFQHEAFGLFIEELLKCEKVNITNMCHEIRMSKASFEKVKKGRINV